MQLYNLYYKAFVSAELVKEIQTPYGPMIDNTIILEHTRASH